MKKQYLQINLQSTNKGINIFSIFLMSVFKKLKIEFKYVRIPTLNKHITLLKSPHVNKKAREQFEIKKFKKIIIIKSVLKLKYLKFILLNKPKFIKLTIIKHNKNFV